MSHFCRFCSSSLPNEAFSGGGHRVHVCRACRRLPPDRRAAIEASEEIHGFLFRQSRISPRNLQRLRSLCGSSDPETARMAAAVLAVGLVAPFKRRRFQLLRRSHPQLLGLLENAGLLSASADPSRFSEDGLWASDDPDSPSALDKLFHEASVEGPPSLTSSDSDTDDDVPF